MKTTLFLTVFFMAIFNTMFAADSLSNYVVLRIADSLYVPYMADSIADKLFFTGDKINSNLGTELYYIDNKSDSVKLFMDIDPGSEVSQPHSYTIAGDLLYFITNPLSDGTRHLWRTDGTKEGTLPITESVSDEPNGQKSGLTAVGDLLYYNSGSMYSDSYYYTDGTDSGTGAVKMSKWVYPTVEFAFGNKLFLTVRDTMGEELWSTNGPGTGTHLVKDFWPNSTWVGNGIFNSSYPHNFADLGDGHFVVSAKFPVDLGGDDYITANQLFTCTGNASSINQITDVKDSYYCYTYYAAADGKLFFKKKETSGHSDGKIYCYNGTTIVPIFEFTTDYNEPLYTLVSTYHNGNFYFTAQNTASTAGYVLELWKSDGTALGTKKIIDNVGFSLNALQSFNNDLIGFGGKVVAIDTELDSLRVIYNSSITSDYLNKENHVKIFNNAIYVSNTNNQISKIALGKYSIEAPDTVWIEYKEYSNIGLKLFPENASTTIFSSIVENPQIVNCNQWGELYGSRVGETNVRFTAWANDSVYKDVYVIVAKAEEASISKFEIEGQIGESLIYDTESSSAKHIQIFMPAGSDLSKLNVSTFKLSLFAVSSVALDSLTDFTTPTTFSISSGDGDLEYEWTIEVLMRPNLSDYQKKEITFINGKCSDIDYVCPDTWQENGLDFSITKIDSVDYKSHGIYQIVADEYEAGLFPAQLNISSKTDNSQIGFVEFFFAENCGEGCSNVFGILEDKQIGNRALYPYRKVCYYNSFLDNPVQQIGVNSFEGSISKLIVWTKPIATSDLKNNKEVNNSIGFYPNPVLNKIFLTNASGLVNYKLFSLSGVCLNEGQTENEINIEKLNSGMYLLQVENNAIIYNLKIIKK